MGTYIGSPSNLEDEKVLKAIIRSVTSGGFNVIDTAINYRFMKAERTVGLALQILENDYKIYRDELFVSSKIGYIPEDADRAITLQQYIENLVKNDIITPEDVVGEVHCMKPKYLEHQIDASLKNLNCET